MLRDLAPHAASFRVGSSIALPAIIRSLGHPAEAVFEAARVDPALYLYPENRVSAADLGRLLRCASEVTGRCDIGLLIAGSFRPGDLGLVGELASEGPDVVTALRNLVRLLQHNTLAGYPKFFAEHDSVVFGFSLRSSDFEGASFVLEGATAIIFRFMRFLCGASWRPEEVHLARRRPSDARKFEQFFGVPIRFSSTEDAVVFARHWLEAKVAREQQRRDTNKLAIAAAPFSELVRRQIALRVGLAPIDAVILADSLGVSRRALFRQLRAEGTTCQALIDDVKFTRARHLLSVGDAPLVDIAFALGFPNQGTFTRAFGRWSGLSPGAWRRQSRPVPTGAARL